MFGNSFPLVDSVLAGGLVTALSRITGDRGRRHSAMLNALSLFVVIVIVSVFGWLGFVWFG
tara:strand:- start:239 stop:421 length:183 start_codon:yes stop_codon:yes gene_type:complete